MYSVDWKKQLMVIGDRTVRPDLSESGWGLLDLLTTAPGNSATFQEIQLWMWPPSKTVEDEIEFVRACVIETNQVLEPLTPDVKVNYDASKSLYHLAVVEPTRYFGTLEEDPVVNRDILLAAFSAIEDEIRKPGVAEHDRDAGTAALDQLKVILLDLDESGIDLETYSVIRKLIGEISAAVPSTANKLWALMSNPTVAGITTAAVIKYWLSG